MTVIWPNRGICRVLITATNITIIIIIIITATIIIIVVLMPSGQTLSPVHDVLVFGGSCRLSCWVVLAMSMVTLFVAAAANRRRGGGRGCVGEGKFNCGCSDTAATTVTIVVSRRVATAAAQMMMMVLLLLLIVAECGEPRASRRCCGRRLAAIVENRLKE